MKLWVDDQIDDKSTPDRHTPVGWVGAKTPTSAIRLLKTGKVTHVDLDHDLGDNVLGNGYTVCLFIEKMAFLGKLPKIVWNVHSANPVGRAKMEHALRKADFYWSISENESTQNPARADSDRTL